MLSDPIEQQRILRRHLAAATSVASGRPTPGIAIVGLDRGHDRFGRPHAPQRRYRFATIAITRTRAPRLSLRVDEPIVGRHRTGDEVLVPVPAYRCGSTIYFTQPVLPVPVIVGAAFSEHAALSI